MRRDDSNLGLPSGLQVDSELEHSVSHSESRVTGPGHWQDDLKPEYEKNMSRKIKVRSAWRFSKISGHPHHTLQTLRGRQGHCKCLQTGAWLRGARLGRKLPRQLGARLGCIGARLGRDVVMNSGSWSHGERSVGPLLSPRTNEILSRVKQKTSRVPW